MSIYNLKIFSGGAVGVDYLADKHFSPFALVTHVSFKGHDVNKLDGVTQLRSQDSLDRALPFYTFACKLLGKNQTTNTFVKNLCLRNFYQVAPSNIVYAFGHFDSSTGLMEGGTGYAVEYAKMLGKIICVTDIDKEEIWSTDNGVDWTRIYDYAYYVNYKNESIAVIGTRKPNPYCETMIERLAFTYNIF
jgi:hypothetical protein